MDSAKLSQTELEQPVKGYQLQAVAQELSILSTEIAKISKSVESINNQTKGVVVYDQMKAFVDERISEKTAPLWEFKKNTNKLGWALALLIVGDIASRILK